MAQVHLLSSWGRAGGQVVGRAGRKDATVTFSTAVEDLLPLRVAHLVVGPSRGGGGLGLRPHGTMCASIYIT